MTLLLIPPKPVNGPNVKDCVCGCEDDDDDDELDVPAVDAVVFGVRPISIV